MNIPVTIINSEYRLEDEVFRCQHIETDSKWIEQYDNDGEDISVEITYCLECEAEKDAYGFWE